MSATDHGYWRSLEQLSDDDRAREFLEREFPRDVTEPPDGVSRRTMLALLGASLSLAGLTACRRPVEKIVPYVEAPEDGLPGLSMSYATTMPDGNGAQGLLVESHGGRPTKIEGNPQHPTNAGRSSARTQAAILGLYDPDRSPHATHAGQKKSWAEFAAAWGELDARFAAAGGEGLALLCEPFTSPTLARLAGEFAARFPAARIVSWTPVSDETLLDGTRQAFGEALQPLYHFDRAKVILALDSDFLMTESDELRNARGFAAGRRITQPSDSMNRLYVAEATQTVTGGNADHRLRWESGRIGTLLARLGGKLGAAGAAAALDAATESWLDAVAQDLREAHGSGLIVVGRRQPAAVHAAAMALNSMLGNVGTTLTLLRLPDAYRSNDGELAKLVSAMNGGAVACLVTLGANPVYAAPVDADFGAALAKVETTIHFGMYRDETAALCGWHVPQAHFLESWGDARALDGTLSVVQPLIAPLYEGVSLVEIFSLLAGSAALSAYDQLRESWKALLPPLTFERDWSRLLHDGLLAGSALPPVDPPRADPALIASIGSTVAAAASASSLAIDFLPCASIFDGRDANNGWLQEMPDPVTKLSWDNAALISPATAAALGLANEDMATLTFEGRRLEIAVWIVPGQADNTVAVALGYGRTAVGRVADGRGFNAYSLRTAASPYIGRGAALAKSGAKYLLASTQDHGSMEGRPIIREASLDHFRSEPQFAREMVEHPPLESLWKDHAYDQGPQWGMTIDLTSCTGCNACVVACQSENNIPIVGKEEVRNGREMHWIRVDRYFSGDTDEPSALFQPVPCMHCENAPCEQVCPVAATVHDSEGLNTMVYNRCIGTRYCANNCPYKVRRFNFFNFTKDTPEVQKMANNPDVTVRSRGVMEKCTFCTQRINVGKAQAKLDGRQLADGDVRTACQQACPTQAIEFGDITDRDSAVSRAKAQDRDYVMLAELNNRPRTSYLAKIRNPHPSLVSRSEPAAEGHHG